MECAASSVEKKWDFAPIIVAVLCAEDVEFLIPPGSVGCCRVPPPSLRLIPPLWHPLFAHPLENLDKFHLELLSDLFG